MLFHDNSSSRDGSTQRATPVGRSRSLQQFPRRPHVVCNAGGHGGFHAKRLVAAHEVVPGEVKAVGSPQVFPFLAERVRQPGHAAHLHPNRETLTFDVGCANLDGVRVR